MKSILKSNDLIEKRNKLSKEIMRYWHIVRTENVIKKGYTRNYELKNVLKLIQKSAEERIKIKLYIQCINMGLKKFSDLPTGHNYYDIYLVSELKLQIAQLDLVKTINPAKKRAKGKNALPVTEELTAAYINKLKAELQLQINEIDLKIKDFNDNHPGLEIDDETKVVEFKAAA